MQKLVKLAFILWTSPNTLIGLTLGVVGVVSGGQAQIRRGTVEFHGGLLRWILAKTPIKAVAMTLGHTIIGQDANCLDAARNHEQVHVRQYERWGPFFIPAYLLSSLYLWVLKKDPYRDNPFEVEAYEKESIDFGESDAEH